MLGSFELYPYSWFLIDDDVYPKRYTSKLDAIKATIQLIPDAQHIRKGRKGD